MTSLSLQASMLLQLPKTQVRLPLPPSPSHELPEMKTLKPFLKQIPLPPKELPLEKDVLQPPAMGKKQQPGNDDYLEGLMKMLVPGKVPGPNPKGKLKKMMASQVVMMRKLPKVYKMVEMSEVEEMQPSAAVLIQAQIPMKKVRTVGMPLKPLPSFARRLRMRSGGHFIVEMLRTLDFFGKSCAFSSV